MVVFGVGQAPFATGPGVGQEVLAAQELIPIGESPDCDSCRAGLSPVVRLGSLDDPAGFGPVVQIARNSRSEYVVSSATFDGELLVYGEDGSFLHTVGRRGEGPGEFRRMQLLDFDAHDSLHAVETSGPRHSVFAPDFSFARSVQMQTRTMAMRIEESGAVFAVAPAMTDSGSYALQRISPDGTGLAAFDSIEPGARGPAAMGRNITVDPAGRRWSVGMADYRVKQWGEDGGLIRIFEARREWIPESIPMRLERDQRPPGQMAGLEADERGLLWVFAAVPDADWAPPSPGTRPSPKTMYDTVVEVIDPAEGTLLARSTFDDLVIPFATGFAYSMVEESSGDLRVQIWRLDLSGR
jgi:hypothetical protein